MVGDSDERQSVLGNFSRLGDYLKKVQWSSFLILKEDTEKLREDQGIIKGVENGDFEVGLKASFSWSKEAGV